MASEQNSNSQLKSFRIRFLARWFAAHILGLLTTFILVSPFYFLSGDNPMHKGIAGGALGAGIGFGQWFALRQQLGRPGWWLIVSTIGGALGGTIFGYGTTEEFTNRGLSRDFVGVVLGGSIGLLQFLVLRNKFRFSYWWILINGAALASGWWLGSSIDFGLEYTSVLSLLVGLIVIFFPYLIISGLGMAWILRYPKFKVQS